MRPEKGHEKLVACNARASRKVQSGKGHESDEIVHTTSEADVCMAQNNHP